MLPSSKLQEHEPIEQPYPLYIFTNSDHFANKKQLLQKKKKNSNSTAHIFRVMLIFHLSFAQFYKEPNQSSKHRFSQIMFM